MIKTELILPSRESKPRNMGLTILIDNGTPIQYFKDTITSSHSYIDLVKFGRGTSLVTQQLEQKITCLQNYGIPYFFGGTLFEKFYSQNKVDDYYDYCKKFQCQYVEISNGTVDMSNNQKSQWIKAFSEDFTVFSEVGNKDPAKAQNQTSTEWIENIYHDLEAGAEKVITEARESGKSGICSADGGVRTDIFDLIFTSEIPLERLIFEAPNKHLQTFFLKQLGSNANLANIALSDVISLETLRLGLRSDTFFTWEEAIVQK